MQPRNDRARIGYGMLAFKLFGTSHLNDLPDYGLACADYSKGRATRTKFSTWYERYLLDRHSLPDNFVQGMKNALGSLERHFGHRYRQVIDMRYGLNDGVGKTLKEISLTMHNMNTGKTGVTQQRVRQMEIKALRGLNHYCACSGVEASLDDNLRELFGFQRAE